MFCSKTITTNKKHHQDHFKFTTCMKRFSVVRKSIPLFLLLSIFIFSDPLFAQMDSAGTILFISCNKTTSLVFPQIIKSIDRGSRDVFAQKVGGVENVLQ